MKLNARILMNWRDQPARDSSLRFYITPEEWVELCDLAIKGLAPVPEERAPTADMVALAHAQLMSVVKPGEDAGCDCGPCKLAREVLRLSASSPQKE